MDKDMESKIMKMNFNEFKNQTNIVKLIKQNIDYPFRVDIDFNSIDSHAKYIFEKYLKSDKYRKSVNQKLRIVLPLNEKLKKPMPASVRMNLIKKIETQQIKNVEDSTDSDTSYNSIKTVIERKITSINQAAYQHHPSNSEGDIDFDRILNINKVSFKQFKEYIMSKYEVTEKCVPKIHKLYMLSKGRAKELLKQSQEQNQSTGAVHKQQIPVAKTNYLIDHPMQPPQPIENQHNPIGHPIQQQNPIDGPNQRKRDISKEEMEDYLKEEKQKFIRYLRGTSILNLQILEVMEEELQRQICLAENGKEVVVELAQPENENVDQPSTIPLLLIKKFKPNGQSINDATTPPNIEITQLILPNSDELYFQLIAPKEYVIRHLRQLKRIIRDYRLEVYLNAHAPVTTALFKEIQHKNRLLKQIQQSRLRSLTYYFLELLSPKPLCTQTPISTKYKEPWWPEWLVKLISKGGTKNKGKIENTYDMNDLFGEMQWEKIDNDKPESILKFNTKLVTFKDFVIHSNFLLITVKCLKAKIPIYELSLPVITNFCRLFYQRIINENRIPQNLLFSSNFAFAVLPNLLEKEKYNLLIKATIKETENKNCENVNLAQSSANKPESPDLFASSGETKRSSEVEIGPNEEYLNNYFRCFENENENPNLDPQPVTLLDNDKQKASSFLKTRIDENQKQYTEHPSLNKDIKEEPFHKSCSSNDSSVEFIAKTIDELIVIDEDIASIDKQSNKEHSTVPKPPKNQQVQTSIVCPRRRKPKTGYIHLPKRKFAEKFNAPGKRKATETGSDNTGQIRHEFRPLNMVKKSRIEKTTKESTETNFGFNNENPELIDFFIEDASQILDNTSRNQNQNARNLESPSVADLLDKDCSIFLSSRLKEKDTSSEILLNLDSITFISSDLNTTERPVDQRPNEVKKYDVLQQPLEILYRPIHDGTAFTTITELYLNISDTRSKIKKLNYTNSCIPFLQPIQNVIKISLTMKTIINIGKYTKNTIKIKENPMELIINLSRSYGMLRIYNLLKSFDELDKNYPFGARINKNNSTLLKLEYQVLYDLFDKFPKFQAVKIYYNTPNVNYVVDHSVKEPKKHLTEIVKWKLLNAIELN